MFFVVEPQRSERVGSKRSQRLNVGALVQERIRTQLRVRSDMSASVNAPPDRKGGFRVGGAAPQCEQWFQRTDAARNPQVRFAARDIFWQQAGRGSRIAGINRTARRYENKQSHAALLKAQLAIGTTKDVRDQRTQRIGIRSAASVGV